MSPLDQLAKPTTASGRYIGRGFVVRILLARRAADSCGINIVAFKRAELQRTSASMQALVGDLHELVSTPEVPAVLAGIEAGGQSLVDAAAWRLLQLMLLFFALLLGYRFVSARIGRA